MYHKYMCVECPPIVCPPRFDYNMTLFKIRFDETNLLDPEVILAASRAPGCPNFRKKGYTLVELYVFNINHKQQLIKHISKILNI